MINKFFSSISDAINDIKDSSSVMIGGFGLSGNPEYLIEALSMKNLKKIKLISNNCGTAKTGLGILINKMQIKKFLGSFIGGNNLLVQSFLQGQIEVELMPQGNFVEKIRNGGNGIPAFYSPTGVKTLVHYGYSTKYNKTSLSIQKSSLKETKIFENKLYILETSIKADFSFIKAYKSDMLGNLIFNKTSQNFNSAMATAGKIVIAEVDIIVNKGTMDVDHIHVPGIYIDRIVLSNNSRKFVEKLY
jgi:3-oxoacid CoA-transferase subunit A